MDASLNHTVSDTRSDTLDTASSNESRPRRAIGLALGTTLLMMQGCAVTPDAAAQPPGPEARVIVRFHPGSPDPADAAFRARVATAAHVSGLHLLRPMSGDAYVMTVGCADPTAAKNFDAPDPCASAIRRLAATEWIIGIENDGRQRHQ